MTYNQMLIISLLILTFSTMLGSSFVFLVRSKLSNKASNLIIGLASGIMISVSFFGLLLPSIEQANNLYGKFSVIAVIGGFLLGGLLLFGLDKIIPHTHPNQEFDEGIKTKNFSKNIKMLFAMMMHNVPEGIAVGLAIGLAKNGNVEAIYSALGLAIGISIQNIPEGAAVSIPMLDNNTKKSKAFLLGALSGIVEPLVCLIALFLSTILKNTMPILLTISAGAMIYVTIEELLPEARKGDDIHYGIWAFMIGFAIMMIMEIAL